jgi:monoamine oxidase
MVGAGVLASRIVPRIVRAQNGPRIVIVGAGLAGLSAAYQLSARYGLAPVLYEAQAQVGGRASTARGFAAGQHIERGGQFISSGDRRIRQLARDLGVALVDTYAVGSEGDNTYRFFGQRYSYAELEASLLAAEGVARTHAREAGPAARYNRHNDRTVYWDNLSVASWVDTYCPGGLTSAAGQYLKASFETEYAGALSDASALQIIYGLGLRQAASAFDERYVVRDGTDSIATALASRLPSTSIHTGMALQRLQSNPDNSVRCTFVTGSGSIDVDADHVILAVPFSVLREVDYGAMGFDPRLDAAIQSVGMGTNAKLHLQFDSAPWQPNFNGDSLSDSTTGSTWEEKFGQAGSPFFMVAFNGGAFATQYGAAAAHDTAPTSVTTSHLAALESIFPGVTTAHNGTAYLDYWVVDPWVKGSYSFYKVGQMTAFAGLEGVAQGRVHFAGEHTATYTHRATLNGAVESGFRVAKDVARARA